mgnify:CR=1 FL=1
MIRETTVGWGLLGIGWTTGLAYASAVIFYQLATISQHPTQSIIWVVSLLTIIIATIYVFKQVGNKQPDVDNPMNFPAH